jgi:hypothetical protein
MKKGNLTLQNLNGQPLGDWVDVVRPPLQVETPASIEGAAWRSTNGVWVVTGCGQWHLPQVTNWLIESSANDLMAKAGGNVETPQGWRGSKSLTPKCPDRHLRIRFFAAKFAEIIFLERHRGT